MKIQTVHKSEIKVSDDYLVLIRRHTDEERKRMLPNLKTNGIQKPLEISSITGLLVDGMGRFELGCEIGIDEFPVIYKDFDSVVSEKLYIIDNTKDQRQLDSWWIGKLNEKKKEILAELKNNNSTNQTAQNCAVIGKSAKLISDDTGISTRNQEKVTRILKDNNPEIIEKLDDGKITINKAEAQIKKQNKFKEKKKLLKKVRVNLPDSVKLYNKAFQKCEIKNKVKMVFTDPPYLETDLPLIEDLARYVMNVLEEGGIFLCLMGQNILNKAMRIFEDVGLTYQWIFQINHTGKSKMFWKNRIMAGYKPLLFFSKGKYKWNESIRDVIESEFQGKEFHIWAQSSKESDYYIDHMTMPGETVCDPCMGSGIFGVSTVSLKRKFIGIEIDKEHFQTASKQISLVVENSK